MGSTDRTFPALENETIEEYHTRVMRERSPRSAREVFLDPKPQPPLDAQGDRYEERAGVLDDAKAAITGDRNAKYGRPAANFRMIADLWKGMGITVQGEDVKPHHVAMALALLKISRLTWSPDHKDNWVDLAGYAGCGYEAYLEDDRI